MNERDKDVSCDCIERSLLASSQSYPPSSVCSNASSKNKMKEKKVLVWLFITTGCRMFAILIAENVAIIAKIPVRVSVCVYARFS